MRATQAEVPLMQRRKRFRWYDGQQQRDDQPIWYTLSERSMRSAYSARLGADSGRAPSTGRYQQVLRELGGV